MLERNNGNTFSNDDYTIESEEISSLRDKHGKLLFLFDNAFSIFHTKRGMCTNEMHTQLLVDLEHVR